MKDYIYKPLYAHPLSTQSFCPSFGHGVTAKAWN